MQKIFQNIYFQLFPESLIKKDDWKALWNEKEWEHIVKVSRFCIPVATTIWLAHYWIFDIPMNLQPRENWFALRLYPSIIMYSLWIFYWIPAFTKSKFVRWPLAACLVLSAACEGIAYLWWDGVPFLYLYLMAIAFTLILAINMFWSLLFMSSTVGLQWVFVWESQRQIIDNMSATILSLLILIGLKLRHKKDIEMFISEKQRAELEQDLLKNELELTGAVQNLLLPEKQNVKTDAFDISGFYRAAEHCGGDWWWMDDRNGILRIVVGDVTGHGAGPAMVTAATLSNIKLAYKQSNDFQEILDSLCNEYEDSFGKSDYWTTLFACEIDFNRDSMKSWFFGAPPIVFQTRSGKWDAISKLGRPIGSGNPFAETHEQKVSDIERLYIVTDGIFETKKQGSDREMGLRQFIRIAKKESSGSIETSISKIVEKTDGFRGDYAQDDDYTMVGVQFH